MICGAKTSPKGFKVQESFKKGNFWWLKPSVFFLCWASSIGLYGMFGKAASSRRNSGSVEIKTKIRSEGALNCQIYQKEIEILFGLTLDAIDFDVIWMV